LRKSFLNLLRRVQPTVAWTHAVNDAVDHYLWQNRFVRHLEAFSNIERMEPDEVNEHFRALEEIIAGLGGVPIYHRCQYIAQEEVLGASKRVFQIGKNYLNAAVMNNYNNRCIEVDVSGENSREVEAIFKAITPWVRCPPTIETTTQVYTITQDKQGGFNLRSLGKTEVPLEPENYEPKVVEAYHHMAGCLTAPEPCGRFCLLDGPPGTGKSYLIRNLISCLDAIFILVPTAMLGSLSGPALLPVFAGIHGNEKPIILILEDADMALVNRDVSRGNASALAEILNLGDGLVGEMLDLRIIATTNAERIDLDPAIMRPGRMCTHMTLGELPTPHLASIYDRLTESERGADLVQKVQAKTLAEIYKLARDSGWAPKVADSRGGYL
jgi:hypothetical protein